MSPARPQRAVLVAFWALAVVLVAGSALVFVTGVQIQLEVNDFWMSNNGQVSGDEEDFERIQWLATFSYQLVQVAVPAAALGFVAALGALGLHALRWELAHRAR